MPQWGSTDDRCCKLASISCATMSDNPLQKCTWLSKLKQKAAVIVISRHRHWKYSWKFVWNKSQITSLQVSVSGRFIISKILPHSPWNSQSSVPSEHCKDLSPKKQIHASSAYFRRHLHKQRSNTKDFLCWPKYVTVNGFWTKSGSNLH